MCFGRGWGPNSLRAGGQVSFVPHADGCGSPVCPSLPTYPPVTLSRAATRAEAEELIALAASKGVVLSVYHNRRWDGDFLTIKGLVEGDALGALALFQMRFGCPVSDVGPEHSTQHTHSTAHTPHSTRAHTHTTQHTHTRHAHPPGWTGRVPVCEPKGAGPRVLHLAGGTVSVPRWQTGGRKSPTPPVGCSMTWGRTCWIR